MNPPGPQSSDDLLTILSEKIVGQEGLFKHILPYIRMYKAGLSPMGRPIGNFLLLGPTGTGKTRTVEALAEALHGNYTKFLRIDCGEFQLEHEVAKLIGAPPGYMGHRETQPMLSERRLSEVTTEGCDISLVLFDEIEKAANSVTRLLLGVLDKATLQLGDNTTVNFEHSLIFLTSNLGASQMMKELRPGFGFSGGGGPAVSQELPEKLESIALAAVKKKFSPEFVNRIDAVVTYQPLSRESLVKILQHQIDDLREHINTRLGAQSFQIDLSDGAREFLLERGTSVDYGARELKRVMHRFVMQPLATVVAEGRIGKGARVLFDVDTGGEKLAILTPEEKLSAKQTESKPFILVVDDNRDLLDLLRGALQSAKWDVMTAGTVARAVKICSRAKPALAIVDYLLQDASGLSGLDLSKRLQAGTGLPSIIVMTGGQLSADEQELCRKSAWLLLQKPFLMRDLMALVETRMNSTGKAKAAGG